jgi:hypothetical protein
MAHMYASGNERKLRFPLSIEFFDECQNAQWPCRLHPKYCLFCANH